MKAREHFRPVLWIVLCLVLMCLVFLGACGGGEPLWTLIRQLLDQQ